MDEPAAEYRSAPLTTNRPARLSIHAGYVEVSQVVGLERVVRRVVYARISHVAVRRRLFYADLILETFGGETLEAPGLVKPQAEEARQEILNRL